MSIKKTTISFLSDQITFINNFINIIINNSNGKITCPEYTNNSIDFTNSSSIRASFTLRILNKYDFLFTRDNYNNQTTGYYRITSNQFPSSSSYLRFYSSGTSTTSDAISDFTIRRVPLTLLTTNKIVLLKIGRSTSNNEYPILIFNDNNDQGVFWGDSLTNFTPSITNNLSNTNMVCYQYNRFPYYYNKNNFNDIEISSNKVFTDNSSTKIRKFDTNIFLDCSRVPEETIIAFNNQRYYALNNYLLIPV